VIPRFCSRADNVLCSDWIALNVLRNVALSTNSVAASVESVIQQQFFSLSPMPGQENFQTGGHSTAMSHTPTTSSMLAALQHDAFPPSALDPGAGAFNSDSYASLSFMDSSTPAESGGMAFHDFSAGAGAPSFDMNAFTNGDLGIASTGTPEGSSDAPEPDIEPKTEGV
jgi:regulatory factor X, other